MVNLNKEFLNSFFIKFVLSSFKFSDYFDLKSFPWLCTSGQGNENSFEMFPLQNLQFKPKNSCKYFHCAEKDKENENSDFISSSESHFLTKEEPGQRKRNLTLKENSGKYKMDKHFPRTVEYTAVQCTVYSVQCTVYSVCVQLYTVQSQIKHQII